MGILDAPGVSAGALGRSLRAQGLTLVANGANALNSSGGRGGGAQSSYRIEHYASVTASGLRLVYGNWYAAAGIGGAPNPSPVLVKANLERLSPVGVNTEDRPRIPVTFNGRRYGICDGNHLLISDPVPFAVVAGEKFFTRTSVSANLFGANTPAAPTLTPATTGGGLPTGVQYRLACSYVYSGYESLMGASTQAPATGAGSTNSIVVTSPTAAPAALGYRVWATVAGGSATAAFYIVSPLIPLGTDYTWTTAPSTTAASQATTGGGGGVGVPQGKQTLGGTSFFGLDNGEGSNFLYDLTDDGAPAGHNKITATAYSPIGILGQVPAGPVKPSVGQVGDSIQSGVGDGGLQEAAQGGALRRAVDGITTRTVTSSFVPAASYGLVSAGPIPGETLANFLASNGLARVKAAQLATTVVSNYGTNDMSFGGGYLAAMIVAEGQLFIGAGLKFIKQTFLPRTTSTDGWATAANQTVMTYEPYRLALNAWLRSSTANPSPVVGEVATNSTVNGSNRGFCPTQAFIQGSETVKINGTPSSAYTYQNPTTLADGRKIAGGILFGTAPGSGGTVTFDFTPIPGYKVALGPSAELYDTAALIEVNSSGTASLTGGRWKPSAGAPVDTGTITASAAKTLTDTSKAWTSSSSTQAGFKGYCARITADATTPASVGQVMVIAYNSATILTALTTGWAVTPSVGATYEIVEPYTADGIHPTSLGYMTVKPAIDLTKIA